jgi:glucokinase
MFGMHEVIAYICAYVHTYRKYRKHFYITKIFMKNRDEYAAGVDIGGSHICCGVVNITKGALIGESLVDRDVDNSAPASEILSIWAAAIAESVAAGRKIVPDSEISGVGVAMPGPFDYEHGVSTIEGVGKFENIFGLDVTTSLIARLGRSGIAKILYTNDAAAFALGERLGGAGKGSRRMTGLTLGTGFGSGFIADGRLVTSGESVPANGWVYCLPFDGTIADEVFSTRGLVGKYRELTGKTVSGAKAIADRAGSEDAAAAIFEEYGRDLARFVAPIARRFETDTVVLGGNIARAFPLFAPAFDSYLEEIGENGIHITPSLLGDRAAITGAASLLRSDR